MVYILLIPFDVFASVRHFDTVFEYQDPIIGHLHLITIYDLYFVCYVFMIYMCFIGLPFSYFYAQSVQDAEEEDAGMNGIDSPSESSEEEDQDVE
jgi:hypothetical protein